MAEPRVTEPHTTEPHVTLDPRSLNSVERKLRGPLEDQLTSALQAATVKVRHHYAGENVEQVTTMLLKQAKAGLHPDIAAGFHPDHVQLRQLAETIVGRTGDAPVSDRRAG